MICVLPLCVYVSDSARAGSLPVLGACSPSAPGAGRTSAPCSVVPASRPVSPARVQPGAGIRAGRQRMTSERRELRLCAC